MQVSAHTWGIAAITKGDIGHYTAVSVVKSISGLEGSFGGGAKVTIEGSGLKETSGDPFTKVIFLNQLGQQAACQMTEHSYTKIVCEAPAFANTANLAEMTAEIYIYIGGEQVIV